MSEWLKPLNLQSHIKIGSPAYQYNFTDIPDWISFLIWSGWSMRHIKFEDNRVFMIVLLVSRVCAPAFCAFGSLIAAHGKYEPSSLSWNEFISLPLKTVVYVQNDDFRASSGIARLEGEIGEIWECGGQTTRAVHIISRSKRYSGARFIIPQAGFSKFKFSLIPHLSAEKEGTIKKLHEFYKSVKPSYDINWIFHKSHECSVMTNLAGWIREVDDIRVVLEKGCIGLEMYSLSELLMTVCDKNSYFLSKTLLTSPKSMNQDTIDAPLTILDGYEAVKNWEAVKSKGVIMLLERSEYDGFVDNIIAQLSNARTSIKYPISRGLDGRIPQGIEVNIYSIADGRKR